MTAVIEGLEVENPTAVWMQLMNTRHNVLSAKSAWNPGGWFEQHDARRKVFTMCLANAIRFVSQGYKGEPATYSYTEGSGQITDADLEMAEALVLRAIPKLPGSPQHSAIPQFNDAGGRKHAEILAVLDIAIEMVKPYARTTAMIYADDVMTPDEKAEIDKAVRKAEAEIWEERKKKYRIHQVNGKWRSGDGKFAVVPAWVRYETTHVTTTMVPSAWLPKPRTQADQQQEQFRVWLDLHERRGWDTFWDELLDCDQSDPDFEACQSAKRALAKTAEAEPQRKPARAKQSA
jgi:hypothetical protein